MRWEVFREEEINGFLFREYERFRPKTLILGLPDIGLVGAIAGMHLVRELGLEDVVGIDSYAGIPPVVVVSNGVPKHPIRIYSAMNGEIGILLTDVPLTPPAVVGFSVALVRYAQSRGVENLISVTGLGNPMRFNLDRPSLYALSNNPEAMRAVEEKTGAKRMGSGIIVGPYAIVLKEATRIGLTNTVLLVDAFIDIPDPEAAVVALEALGKLYGLKVDTKKLEEEADKIKLRLRELMKETKSMMARMGKGYELRPSLLYT